MDISERRIEKEITMENCAFGSGVETMAVCDARNLKLVATRQQNITRNLCIVLQKHKMEIIVALFGISGKVPQLFCKTERRRLCSEH
jgi:hypothetical protein